MKKINNEIKIENKALESACTQIVGLKEAIANGTIQMVPFFPSTAQEQYKKRPMTLNGESWTEHEYTIEEFNTVFHDSNVGFKLGKCSNYLACVDIDGYKGGDEDLNIKSCDLIFNALKENIPDFDKKFICEQTSSGRYHLYFFNNPDSPFIKKHESSTKIYYPKRCVVSELSNKSAKGNVEVFDGRKLNDEGEETCNRAVRCSGSIDGDKMNHIISEMNDISKLPIVDDVEEEIRQALLKAGFQEVLDLNNSNFNEFGHENNSNRPIPRDNIPLLAEFLMELYRVFDTRNCKFYATQALAGFLYRHVDVDSASLLGGNMLGLGKGMFDDDYLFYNTLMNDFNNPPASNVLAQGGTKFYEEYCSDFISKEFFWQKMIFLMGGNLEFYVGDRNARQINKIILNREKCKVYLNSYVETKYDDGYYYRLNTSKEIFGLCPVSLEFVSNPLNRSDNKLIMKCVSHHGEEVIEAKNAESLMDSIKNIHGFVLNKLHSSDVLNQIIAKFFELGFVKSTDKSSLSGVFIIDGELVRYDIKGDKVPIARPYEDDLVEALTLLEDVLDVIPHDKGEIGLLLRKYFLYPLHFYFKKNRREVKFITISGTGGTLKSTLAEMILSIYQNIIKSGHESNVIGGGAFDSEFKIANAMSKSTWGFICNEPDTAFGKVELRQILKVATTELSARERNGKKMYSYQSPIFCSNVELPSEPEFLRRIEEFNFSPKCIITEKVKRDLDSLLNENGVQNKNFYKLRAIGDFILHYISQNLILLDGLSYDTMELDIVDELEKYSGKDLSWLKMTREDLDYSNESDSFEEYDNIMELFIKELRMIYNFNHKSCIILRDYVENDSVPSNYGQSVLISLIQKGYYDFLTLLKSDNNFVIIKDKSLSNFFRVNNKAGISGRKFFEGYLTPFEEKYDTMKHGNNRSIDGQVKGTRVPIKFIIDLMNGEAYD